MAQILALACDGGAVNALKPVTELLANHGHSINWVVQEGLKAAGKDLPNKSVIEDNDTDIRLVLEREPDLVLSGVSGNQRDICLTLSQAALEKNIPVVKIVDFWGTGMPHEKNLAVTKVCTLDAPSAAYEAKMRGMSKSDVIVTGAPQFDALLGAKPIPALMTTEDGPLISFVSPSSSFRVNEILPGLEQGLVQSAGMSVRLLTLWHGKGNPWGDKEKGHLAWAPAVEQRLAAIPGVTLIGDKEARELGSMNDIIVSSDLVVGSSSTTLVESATLGRPTLSIMPDGWNAQEKNPELWTNQGILAPRGIMSMPTSDVGASHHSGSFQETADFILRFLVRGPAWTKIAEDMAAKQSSAYSLDGKNTARVVAEIEKLLSA